MEKRIKRPSTTVSTLYFRGERKVKDRKGNTGNMLTLEKALYRLKCKKQDKESQGGGHYK